MEIWRYGDMEIWRYGDMEIWRYGDMEIWRYGDMEIWRYGDMEICGSFSVYFLCKINSGHRQICESPRVRTTLGSKQITIIGRRALNNWGLQLF